MKKKVIPETWAMIPPYEEKKKKFSIDNYSAANIFDPDPMGCFYHTVMEIWSGSKNPTDECKDPEGHALRREWLTKVDKLPAKPKVRKAITQLLSTNEPTIEEILQRNPGVSDYQLDYQAGFIKK
jgi:hypothetical protein